MNTQANIFNLSSGQIHVTYSTGALGSKQSLVYQDAHQTRQFNGDQLRKVATDAGDVISVTLQLTVDFGSTTFSLLVPRVNVDLNQSVNINTLGITALHRFSLIPALNHGQLDTYSVTDLKGIASARTF